MSTSNSSMEDDRARDMNYNWVNEEHMVIFQQALSDEPDEAFDDNDGGRTPTLGKVNKITSVSDFFPVNERVKTKKKRKDVIREGWAYHATRWPLLWLIFSVIIGEFILYLSIRQLVNVIEYFSAWRGARGKLRLALRDAENYEEWKERAIALDNHLQLDSWKKSSQNAYYDAPLIKRVLRSLRELRGKEDVEGVRAVLEVALRGNFGGLENYRLYSETFYGTKDLVEQYVDEVARSIEFVRTAPTSMISLEEKSRFLRYATKNLGCTALCLSGGASFGYYHFGVVRALLDASLLPRVITGTSAGAIIAAFICTRRDSELKEMLIPELADKITACEEPFTVWMKRAWKTGARFDTVSWAKKASFFTMGSMTFKEAFERTGRILNISVIPHDTHSPTKLLNYLTAPDCVIYTAVIASAAVPGILNPVVLLVKKKDGSVHPWEFQGKHKDGSLRSDIPLHSLHLLYNVNFSIVSQVNPHIHLFHFAARGSIGRPVSHRGGKGWRGGFILSSAEQYLKLELTKNFRVLRDLELLPNFGGQNWSAVFLQKFDGTVTLFPKSSLKDWFRILEDPDRVELARMIKVGQTVTWPKIKMIENRMKIERQIDIGREEIARLRSVQGHLHRESSYDLLAPVQDGKPNQDSALPGTNSTSIDQTSESEEGEVEPGDYIDYDETPRATPKGSPKKNRSKELFPLPNEYSASNSNSNSTPTTNGSNSNTRNGRSNSPSPTKSKIPTPSNTNKRRKQILARLGLKNNGSSSNNNNNSSSFRSLYNFANSNGGEEHELQDDSEEGVSGMSESEMTSNTSRTLRRRYSMGTIRLTDRINNIGGVGIRNYIGSGSDSEDIDLHGGYSSRE